MIIKIAGIILVISGFGGWGISGAWRLKKRVKQLQDLRQAFAFLEKEITGFYSPLSIALEKTARFARSPISLLFSASAELLGSKCGFTAQEAWLEGVQRVRQNSCLHEDELDLISSAGGQIGISDALQQRKFLAFIQEQLKIAEEKARLSMESEQKLHLYGGFIIGCVVVLLFL